MNAFLIGFIIGASTRFLAMIYLMGFEGCFLRSTGAGTRKPVFLFMQLFNLKFRRRKLYDQIDEFVEWKAIHYTNISAVSDKEYLLMFATMFPVESVQDIRPEHAEEFGKKMTTAFRSDSAVKALRCLLRYYRARGYICMHPLMAKY